MNIVQYVENSTFDRKYSYDHVGRLSEGLSGTDARGEPYDSNNPNPYKQTYTYDAFDNMSQRTNRWWTQEQGDFNATYVNDRNTAWNYDDAGNLKNNLHGTYKYDTAGRMKEFDSINTVHISQLYDGDGFSGYRLESRAGLTDRATIYYVRSSVLGGQPVTELKANGGKRRTYVYAYGQEIARQEKIPNLPNVVEWITRDPVTGDDDIARDPLGGYIGSESDVLFSDYYELKGNLPTHDTDADPFDSGSGCTLDGVPFDCNSAINLVNQGAAFYAPLKSIEAIYNRQLRRYTGFAIFDPHLGEFVRLTQIKPQKSPPVLVRRNGSVSPSGSLSGTVGDDDDAEPVTSNFQQPSKQDVISRVVSLAKKILKINKNCRELLSTDVISLPPAASAFVSESNMVRFVKRMQREKRIFYTTTPLKEAVADTTSILSSAFIRLGPSFFDASVGGWTGFFGMTEDQARLNVFFHELGHATVAKAANHYDAPANATPAQRDRELREAKAYNRRIFINCIRGMNVQ